MGVLWEEWDNISSKVLNFNCSAVDDVVAGNVIVDFDLDDAVVVIGDAFILALRDDEDDVNIVVVVESLKQHK